MYNFKTSMYRVWPDYTVQETDEPPYSWMSDDYLLVDAESEEDAVVKYKEIHES